MTKQSMSVRHGGIVDQVTGQYIICCLIFWHNKRLTNTIGTVLIIRNKNIRRRKTKTEESQFLPRH